ncbi:hypothetical protein [Thermococcus sp. JdF3]|uniref:hypothetical protein n=1 Tax=Thermococcus sp. JdF3 TaxID=1638258 RepID=UPI00143C9398|nr:hypothetical protein [Thermococcus sp. JdF3]
MIPMENIGDVKKAPSDQKEEKLRGLRKFRGVLGTFDKETIQWAIEEAEEI